MIVEKRWPYKTYIPVQESSEEFKLVLQEEYDRLSQEIERTRSYPQKLEAVRRCMKVYGMVVPK